MKHMRFGLVLLLGMAACANPMYDDVISREEFKAIREEQLGGTVELWSDKDSPMFVRFGQGLTPEEMTNVEAASDAWHIHAFNSTWRFASNSGTSGTEHGTSGNGHVRVYTGMQFEDVVSIDHPGGSAWYTDEYFDYGGGSANLNYALTKGVGSPASETFLFWFDSSQMGSSSAYQAGSEFVFVIRDGSGDNYVKLQPIEIATDNPGSMSFTKRKYVFKYTMADGDGNF